MDEEKGLSRASIWFYLIPVILLVLAPILDWPYSYYELLRIVICISSGLFAYNFHKNENKILRNGFVISAVLFNPIVPMHLEPEVWAIVDYAVAVFYIAVLLKVEPSLKEKLLLLLDKITKGW